MKVPIEEIEVGYELPPLSHVMNVPGMNQGKLIDPNSGEGNAIHFDEQFSRQEGLKAPVATGITSTFYANQLLTDFFGEDWLRGGSLATKFIVPMYFAETTFQKLASLPIDNVTSFPLELRRQAIGVEGDLRIGQGTYDLQLDVQVLDGAEQLLGSLGIQAQQPLVCCGLKVRQLGGHGQVNALLGEPALELPCNLAALKRQGVVLAET